MKSKINFAWPVTSENAVVYQYFLSEINHLKDFLAGKRIVIFGAGIRGCCILRILEKQGLRNIVFCDNNSEKQGNSINDYDILSFEEILRFEENQVFLISPENSYVISKQLSDAELVEGKDWFSFDISVYNAYIREYLRDVTDHMLVVGDCAFSHISMSDEVTDSLGEMIKAQVGEPRCKVLTMHGIGQQANYHIIQSLLDKGERPALLLLLVMEALTPKAHLMPRTQHPALIQSLVEATKNPRVEFCEYARIAKKRFHQFQVESFASFNKGEGGTSEKMYMKMNYLFKIKEQTEGITYLKKTIRMLNDMDIPVVLYVPPVNYMQGERLFGAEFRTGYIDNFLKLYGFLDNENLSYSVADASFLLTEDKFAAVNTIDETTNYDGRNQLLKFLSQSKPLHQFFNK